MWTRPVADVGDTSTAAERSADPTGWSMDAAARTGLSSVVAARRDIRRFRSDDVSDELLNRVLEAGHAAPSVGHSQPWRFIVVRSAATKARAAILADGERLRQADAMDPESARHLRALELHGIRDAPVGIVVCCDRRATPRGVLGRATFADSDMWSCAAAIENIWLTARAEGLGLGWVTLFKPADLAMLVGLPDGVETLGWLCVGWPDERPPSPGLQRAGWSTRLELDDVVFTERWPGTELGETAPPHDHTASGSRVAARDHDDALLAVPHALGLLGRTLAEAPVPIMNWETGTLVIAAADHGVTAHGVSAYPASTTTTVAEALSAGSALGAVAARSAGLNIELVDAGIGGVTPAGWLDRRPHGHRGDLVLTDALTHTDASALLGDGEAFGTYLTARGVVAIGELGVGNTTIAAALACALTGVEPQGIVGRGAGSDSAGTARKVEVVRCALHRTGYGSRIWSVDRPALIQLLASLGGGEVCFLTGLALGVGRAGGVVVLDGMLTGVAALAAATHDPSIRPNLIAGQRSTELGHSTVLNALGLEPLLDLRLRAGEGVGSAMAVSVLRQAQIMRRSAARTS